MIAFSGCTKEEIKNPVSETKTVQFVAESIETKTAFGTPDGTTYPTLWTENDKKISLAFNGTPSDVEVEVAPDFKTARFNSEVKDDASGSYQFLALSPSTAKNSISKTVISANIWTSQTPLDNSVDEAAQVLYSVSETYQAIPSTVSMTFKHFTAYGNLSFKNLNLGEAVVNSVAITSSTNIAGRWNYVVESGEYVVNSGASTITLTTTETDNIWFACAPVGSMEGETLTFTVNTNKGTLSKTVTLKSTHKFEAGKIAKMVVDMDDVAMAKPIVYELVKSVDELTPDSEVIIVAAESNVALSTTQNTNNRGEAGVTKSKDKSTIENPTDAVQVLVVGEGNTDGTISFSTGDKYLYAPGGGNYLRSTNELSDNASWTVTVADGIATITAKRDNKNLMRYNATSKLFSCYDSGQKDVSIYKLQGSGTVLENYLKVSEENIEVDADETKASFTVKSDLEWTATSEDVDAAVSVEDNTVTVEFPENEDADEKVYTVTVSADGVDPVTVTITQAAYVDPTVINEVTITEFLAATVSDVKYKLTGVIEGIYNTTYGNFYLNDGTTKVLVYGLTATEQQSNDKSFASLGLRDGDELTLIGKRADYNGTPQVGGPAYYVSHVAAPYLEVSSKTINVAADATSASFSVDSNLAWTATSEDATVSVSDKTVKVEFLANEDEEKKTYTVTVSADGVDPVTVTVTQAAYEDPNAGGGEDVAEWNLESWSKCNATTNVYGTGNFEGDLGTWSYTGCSSYDATQFETKKSLALGKTADNSSITSPIFNNGVKGIKFNYFANNTARKVVVTVYENGEIVKTETITPKAKNTLGSAEITVETSGPTYFTFTPGSADRRVSVGDIQVKY